MKILGIETSCDETAAAVVEVSRAGKVKILSNIVSSQIKIHKKYGGVVPEVAARKHAEVIFDVVAKALGDANDANFAQDFPLRRRGIKGDLKINSPQPSLSEGGRMSGIDLIAVTCGPGLVTSLRVGVLAAQTVAALAKKPLVGVNHIEAHLLSPFLSNKKIKLPALGLVVSGGHTELILMKAKPRSEGRRPSTTGTGDFGKYKIIGATRDDAVGEAFDKAAKILNIGYPGGPAIAREAERITNDESCLPAGRLRMTNIKLPRPMMNSGDFDFSFAGLKTAVLYLTKKMTPQELKEMTPAIAAEFQNAAVEVLVAKTKKAAEKYKVKSILVGGGVSANHKLRAELQKLDFPVYLPEMQYTGDNAAMIAFAGYHKYLREKKNEVFNIVAEPNLSVM